MFIILISKRRADAPFPKIKTETWNVFYFVMLFIWNEKNKINKIFKMKRIQIISSIINVIGKSIELFILVSEIAFKRQKLTVFCADIY